MKYTVTIMNDRSFTDGHGFVHTWLAYQKGDGKVRYFSFSDNSLYGKPSVFTDDDMKGRPTSRTNPIVIDLNGGGVMKGNPSWRTGRRVALAVLSQGVTSQGIAILGEEDEF